METSLHVAAAGQLKLRQQLTVVANNIANVNTAGFRAEIVDFKNIISRSSQEDVHFPVVSKLYPSLEQGSLERTDNPLDIALSGEGWFSISTPAGNAYTRDGRLTINSFGGLQTLEGYQILDAGGAPIQLDPKAEAPEILQDGRIVSKGQQLGNIGVFQLPAEALTSRYSNSAFLSSVAGIPTPIGNDVTINQGFIEQSNVSAVSELANLITITMAYENVSSIVGKVDDALNTAVRELSP